MYKNLIKNLENLKKPIKMALVGPGWFGEGLLRQIKRTPNIDVKYVLDRTSKLSDIKKMDIDLLFDATGDIDAGTEAAIHTITTHKHFITVSSELDATVGPELKKLADDHGVVYSNCDGDQPGCLSRLIDEVLSWDFKPVIVGDCKNFLDKHQTPSGVLPYVPEGQKPIKICSYADGTKEALEMAALGNGYGYTPMTRGMYGLKSEKYEIIKRFDEIVHLDTLKEGHIDFILGMEESKHGGPVFVIAKSDDPYIQKDMIYLKAGFGPYYLFFRNYHLCYFEAISTIAEVYLFEVPTLAPIGRYNEVITIAKKDLEPGQTLDGIGGYDCYGEADSYEEADKYKLLPMGLCYDAEVIRPIDRDQPIRIDDVIIKDTAASRLRNL